MEAVSTAMPTRINTIGMRYPRLPADFTNRSAVFDLLQDEGDLRLGELRPLHEILLLPKSGSKMENPSQNGKFLRTQVKIVVAQ
jgi:hypothetical protein